MGYYNAGFEVIGVDIEPQENYPFKFVQADAIEYALKYADDFDFIHASPPCQLYSATDRLNNNSHPDLVEKTREAISHKPYVIENVVGAPLKNPILLCGAMFDLKTYRHRLFESNMSLIEPNHPEHIAPQAKMGRSPKPGEFIQVVGHFSGKKYAQEAMGIDWMIRDEMAQAIPPAYSEYIGKQIIRKLGN